MMSGGGGSGYEKVGGASKSLCPCALLAEFVWGWTKIPVLCLLGGGGGK